MANASSLHYKQDIFVFPSRDYLVYLFFLFIWCHGDTSAQAGRIQLHAEKGNFIQAVLLQPLICLVANFSSENL